MPKDENRYTKMITLPARYHQEWNGDGTGNSILLCPKCSNGRFPKEIDQSLGNIHQHSVEYDNSDECVKIKYWCEFHSYELMTLYMNQHKGNTYCYWDAHCEINQKAKEKFRQELENPVDSLPF